MNRASRVVFLALAALLVISSLALADTFEAQVVRVVDGDTIDVLAGGQKIRLRFPGIDCPEMKQPGGPAAKRFVSELVSGKVVIVRGSKHGKYGRLLADVLLTDGRDLSRMLVASGHAWWYRKYAPNNPVLQLLENEARKAKRGLWVDSSPIPPWEFRHNRHEGSSAFTSTSMPQPSPTLTVKQDRDERITVYITRTGEKYHRANCRYLSKSKIPISLAEAKRRGYTPCKVCKPPISSSTAEDKRLIEKPKQSPAQAVTHVNKERNEQIRQGKALVQRGEEIIKNAKTMISPEGKHLIAQGKDMIARAERTISKVQHRINHAQASIQTATNEVRKANHQLAKARGALRLASQIATADAAAERVRQCVANVRRQKAALHEVQREHAALNRQIEKARQAIRQANRLIEKGQETYTQEGIERIRQGQQLVTRGNQMIKEATSSLHKLAQKPPPARRRP